MSRPFSAAAAVTILGGVALAVYKLWPYAVSATLMWVAWRVWLHKLGWRPRRGRTVLELLAAGVGAWWLARRSTR